MSVSTKKIPIQGQYSLNEIMQRANAKRTAEATFRQSRLNETDVDFIMYGVDQHIDLIRHKKSVPYEGNIRQEKAQAYQLATKLAQASDSQKNPLVLTKEEWEFISFVLSEYLDRLEEGSVSAYTTRDKDLCAYRTVLRKLRIKARQQDPYCRPAFPDETLFQ